jgi:hypothetical protein
MSGVTARLLASVIALCAGAAALVVVIVLAHDTFA